MNILLFSMPDSFEHMPTIAIRMPNGALTSLAGNVDPHHRIAAADLLLVQSRVRETVERLVAEHEPDVVGLSVMTFQRKTAKGIIDLVRTRRPGARVVVGGYDPSLAPKAYIEDPDGGVDFIVRGEGEITFRELLRALEAQRGYDHIAGLSYRSADGFHHNRAMAMLAPPTPRCASPSRRFSCSQSVTSLSDSRRSRAVRSSLAAAGKSAFRIVRSSRSQAVGATLARKSEKQLKTPIYPIGDLSNSQRAGPDLRPP